MNWITQKTPIFNPNDESILVGSKMIGNDGNVYIKMKELNKDRQRWKFVSCKEINKDYFQIRLNYIKYISKRVDTNINKTLKTASGLIAFPPGQLIIDKSMIFDPWKLNNGSDYWVYLLFMFLDYNQIDPFEFFGIKLELGERNPNPVRKTADRFLTTTRRLTKVLTKYYPNTDFSILQNIDSKYGILYYLLIKNKGIIEPVAIPRK